MIRVSTSFIKRIGESAYLASKHRHIAKRRNNIEMSNHRKRLPTITIRGTILQSELLQSDNIDVLQYRKLKSSRFVNIKIPKYQNIEKKKKAKMSKTLKKKKNQNIAKKKVWHISHYHQRHDKFKTILYRSIYRDARKKK